MYYVYAHIIEDTSEVFYIGKGKIARTKSNSRRNPYWYNIVQKHDFKTILLFESPDEAEALEIEKYFIKILNPRTNISTGGESGRTGVKTSDTTKLLLKKSNEKTWFLRSKKFLCLEDDICFFSLNSAAEYYGFHKSSIHKAIKRNGKLHNKTFRYI